MASTYTVVSGDSMWQIANAHGVELDALISANPQVQNPSVIEVGQVLNLPPAGGGSHAAAGQAGPLHPPRPAPAPADSRSTPTAPANPSPPTAVPYTPPPPPPPGAPTYKTVAYFTNWSVYGRNYQPQDVPADHITHILYSFANIRPTGEVFLSDTYSDLEKHYPADSWNESGENVYGCVKQFLLLKQKYRHLKMLLSVGGWTFSSNFAGLASTPQGRQNFARSAVRLIADLGFDGIDIDWEYPQNDAEAWNFVLLLQETRQELDNFAQQNPESQRHLLTFAAPCGAHNYTKLRLAQMDQFLDFWNLMCYDFAGSWDRKSGHQANIFPSRREPRSTPCDADAAIRAYMAGGVHPRKIIFGMPLYGRAFDKTKGPGHSFKGVGEGSWENGVWDYKALPRDGASEHNDKELVASWSYGSKKKAMVSYDTPEIAGVKAQYIRDMGLGGAMWWELSGDHPVAHERSLVRTTVQAFGGKSFLDRSPNTLSYPMSRYDNLRNGFRD